MVVWLAEGSRQKGGLSVLWSSAFCTWDKSYSLGVHSLLSFHTQHTTAHTSIPLLHFVVSKLCLLSRLWERYAVMVCALYTTVPPGGQQLVNQLVSGGSTVWVWRSGQIDGCKQWLRDPESSLGSLRRVNSCQVVGIACPFPFPVDLYQS